MPARRPIAPPSMPPELVGPIIAMTITLYGLRSAGIQGGLTGSLFREFAFLAGRSSCRERSLCLA